MGAGGRGLREGSSPLPRILTRRFGCEGGGGQSRASNSRFRSFGRGSLRLNAWVAGVPAVVTAGVQACCSHGWLCSQTRGWYPFRQGQFSGGMGALR